MGVSSGMFNIIQRGQAYAGAFARPLVSQTAAQSRAKAASQADTGSNPSSWTVKRNESAVDTLWRLAPDQASRGKMVTPATVRNLEKLADGDNKDISAEKMRQAKAKLEGLRRQLQMLAATGDVRQLRRIAAEAASLAREIGAAARAMAQGIGAGQTPSDTGNAQAVANAANSAAAGTTSDAPAQPQSAGQAQGAGSAEAIKAGVASSVDQSFKELNELSNDARNAIVQAKGIISLAAQMARAKRRGADDDDDRYFRDLQEQADAALKEVDVGQREALSALLSQDGTASADSAAVLTTTTVETTVTTAVLIQTEIDVYA